MSKLIVQYKFWNEIRIDTITALCMKRDNPNFSPDEVITVNHEGSLRTFVELDCILCQSMNNSIKELKIIRETLLQAEDKTHKLQHLQELTAIMSFDVDETSPDNHKNRLKTIISKLTMELENTKVFLLGERKETAL